MNPRGRQRAKVVVGVAGGLILALVAPVWGFLGIGDSGDVTLVQILAEVIHSKHQLEQINDMAGKTADLMDELRDNYQRVNAGIEELRGYSWGAFLSDLQNDFYNTYPGIDRLQGRSRNLGTWWNGSRQRSPWTAYEAITAVVGDMSQPLREDVEAKRANVDEELILSSEAAGGFALAHNTEQATRRFDDEAKDLSNVAKRASPGQAEQIQARTGLMLVAQQSHIMRLLARAVRFESTQAALQYGSRMHARNSVYEQHGRTVELAKQALKPPPMMRFEGGM